jgi:hypothetical protein
MHMDSSAESLVTFDASNQRSMATSYSVGSSGHWNPAEPFHVGPKTTILQRDSRRIDNSADVLSLRMIINSIMAQLGLTGPQTF